MVERTCPVLSANNRNPSEEVDSALARQSIAKDTADLDERRDFSGRQGNGDSGTAQLFYARLFVFMLAPLKGFALREVSMSVSVGT